MQQPPDEGAHPALHGPDPVEAGVLARPRPVALSEAATLVEAYGDDAESIRYFVGK